MKQHISVARLVLVIGGAVTFLFSFFSFWGSGGFSVSAWGNGTFPLASIPAILGGAMVVVIVVEQAGVTLPEPVLTFTWRQVRFTWATVAAGIMLGYLIMDKGGASLKFGAILMLLGAIAMAVGAFMEILEKGTNLVAIPGVGGHGQRAEGAAASASAAPTTAAAPGRLGPRSAGDGQPVSPATISAIRSPASVGFRPTRTPAAASASILPCAVPLPPETMAPAWPIFLPAGAVTPAM